MSPDTAARPLAQAGLAFFALFVIWVLVPLLPPQVLNPLWGHRLATSLVDNSPLLILAVCFIHAAALLAPVDGWLQNLKSRVARFLLPLMIGYLLLIPFDLLALSRQFRVLEQQRQARITAMSEELRRAQTLIAAAPDLPALTTSLQAIRGPVLTAQDASIPLNQLKSQLVQVLSQSWAATRIQMRRSAAELQGGMVKEGIRVASTALVIAAVLMSLSLQSSVQRRQLFHLRSEWTLLGKRLSRLGSRSRQHQGERNLRQHARRRRQRERQRWLLTLRQRLSASLFGLIRRPPTGRR